MDGCVLHCCYNGSITRGNITRTLAAIVCHFSVYISLDTVSNGPGPRSNEQSTVWDPAVDRWFVWGTCVNNIGFTVMNGTQCLILTARCRQRTTYYSSAYSKTELSTYLNIINTEVLYFCHFCNFFKEKLLA